VKKRDTKKKKPMKRNTFTFEIEPDNLALMIELAERGRGVKSRVLNQAIREIGREVLKKWDGFRSAPIHPTDKPAGQH
jgi:hypothetical protein